MASLDGFEHFVLQQGDEFLSRIIDPTAFDEHTAKWNRWKDGKLIETWMRHTDYLPSQRPWFQLAEAGELDAIHWTEPYVLHTTKAPGVTVSSKWRKPDSDDIFIAAFDIPLSDISDFTMSLRPSEHGKALVILEDESVLGLPYADRFTDEHVRASAVLNPVSKLELPEVEAAFAEWNRLDRVEGILSFANNDERWWAGFLGDGGNGSVYRVQHALLCRPTAIKVMHPEYARSYTAKARFEHEVQIMSSLTHPNTVAVYDFGQTPEGTLYYAMEYLAGITLEDLVRTTGPQPLERIVAILEQVCGSLSEAHEKKLIHRDIKPANIMLCEPGGDV